MTPNRPLLVGGICLVGFLLGFAGKRNSDPPEFLEADGVSRPIGMGDDAKDRIFQRLAVPGEDSAVSPISTLRSADTLETIISLDGADLYRRLAVWLLDAGESEIAAYWHHFKQPPDRPDDVAELIFIHWTRLNPQAAIAASVGSSAEDMAWRAWACHEPGASLHAALATENPDLVASVVRGIGEFQGAWLRKHIEEIPEKFRRESMEGLLGPHQADAPQEVLDFLKTHGKRFDRHVFSNLVRQDPWAAHDWMKNNAAIMTRYCGSRDLAVELLAQTMAETHSETLKRIADQTPVGEAKRRMEAALFSNLLKQDPEAARAQAEATPSPRIAAERLAAVGLHLAQSDPASALPLVEKLFDTFPSALGGSISINYPNGMRWTGSSITDAEPLVNLLMHEMPETTLESVSTDTQGKVKTSAPLQKLAGIWAKNDLPAYAAWVNQQTDAKIRDPAIRVVVDELTTRQNYQEAAEWARSSPGGELSISNVLYHWNRSKPGEAKAWLETADIPTEVKNKYKRIIDSFEAP